MKRNWINIVAAILIIAGIFLLTRRVRAPVPQQAIVPTTEPMTSAEIKARVITNMSKTLGRPLNDIEKDMIEVNRNGSLVQIKLLEPLRSRYTAARKARLATMPSRGDALIDGLPISPSEPTTVRSSDAAGGMASPMPTTAP